MPYERLVLLGFDVHTAITNTAVRPDRAVWRCRAWPRNMRDATRYCGSVTITRTVTEQRRPREIEVKYRVGDPTEVVAALATRGVTLSDPVLQDDQAYAPSTWSYGLSKISVPFARLRTQNGRHLFTVKTPIANELDCAEQECEISDREQMHEALIAMGFRPTVQLVEWRRSGRAGDMTLCLDEVTGLGAFLEVERLLDDTVDTADVQERMDEFVTSLGITAARVTQTYDSLLRETSDDVTPA